MYISTMVHTFLYYRITYSNITQNFQNIKSCWSVINCHWSSSKSILISIIVTKISGSKVKFPICILVFVKIIEIYKFLHKNNSQMEKICWFFSYKNQIYIYKIHWTDSRLIIKNLSNYRKNRYIKYIIYDLDQAVNTNNNVKGKPQFVYNKLKFIYNKIT